MQDGKEEPEVKRMERTPSEPAEKQPEPEVERDRRGVVLPARQRVGGIITPQ